MERVILRTDRLVLRAPTAADLDAITAACQDPEIPRWTTVPSPYTREDGEDFVRRVAEWWESGEETVWGVFQDDVLIGMIGLHQIAPHATGGSAEIGFWATSGARGQGFMVEAARAVIDWGFADLDLARIAWRAVAGNIPSARTARALGFRYEGLQRQALTSPRGRDDGWFAGLLPTDDRVPVEWSVLE
ncbi:GNAT family N-acetyltransferase [Microbacterium murale]|uniref:RimJ/RimL family protein N-acetyltransferase n=1 Tax=Microbacterium murale TaxID=1081040 RepID=A0ABU0PDW2_9MICO|nr:GNAT family N-acetyltransferase [Microbacterium murale]MDQ0644829.1 RimJ/RimL family protein N-acetyltransferase [Microbacterium murale]